MPTCSYAGCGREVTAKSLCQSHYLQQRRGEVLRPIRPRRNLGLPPTDDLLEALMMRVKTDEAGCWIWQGARRPTGYGTWKWRGEADASHRYMWKTIVGPIPDDLEIDHLCRNRGCVNPEHMELVTHAENMARAVLPVGEESYNGAKSHCPQGHPYDEANTYRWGCRRYCRTCQKARREEKKRR